MQLLQLQDQGHPAWIMEGGRTAAGAESIWSVIERGLLQNQAAVAVTCDDTALSCGGVLDAVRDLPWPHGTSRVGLCMARSAASLIATLAIWRNRAAYVPIATEHPVSKLMAIARSCSLDLIICDRPQALDGYRLIQTTPCAGETMLFYARLDDRGRVPIDDGLCYIAHTSGSSGTPKGVLISHAALINRLRCMQDLLQVTTADRFLYKASVGFDVHVWEMTLALSSGCHLTIYRQRADFNLFQIAELIADDGVTIVGLVPTLLQLVLKMPAFLDSVALRAVLCGGELWRPGLAREFHRQMPGRSLYNSYGPTETTVAVANWQVPEICSELEQIALGQPLDNVVFLIREESRRTTAHGLDVQGELLIGGIQVAIGYVDNAGSRRFSEHAVDGMPMRFYATGDMVRLDVARGLLFFQGREDNQVKVNGVRIELEEIEEAVSAVDQVEACLAFVDDRDPPQLWVAFKTLGDRALDVTVIRQSCQDRLARTMIPAGFLQVPGFPLRESGKIDRGQMMRSVARAEVHA